MNISRNWLNELIQVDNFKDLSEKFNLSSMENTYSKLNESDFVVIGHVLTKTPHPDADKLNVLTVDVKKETLQIVCGAKNVEVGQKVIIALVDAVLPGDFKIKASKIRGVESFGMCCSLTELGIKESLHNEDGIHVLDNNAPVGENALTYLGLNDEIIELDLTPNRSDLLSYLGTAYDVAAILNKKLVLPEIKISESFNNNVNISLESDKCFLYETRVIKNVTIAESPAWLKFKLMSVGVRPINNIVDITNYVLFHVGQPLHAFDLDKFSGDVVVKNASKTEVKLLNETSYKVDENDLVITNGNDIHCVAGVMGGFDSSVTNDTKNILLEAAIFDPTSVRKTSQKLKLRSDSSVRFEKGLAACHTRYALDLATKLMIELAGATEVSTVNSVSKINIEDKTVNISISYLEKIIGIKLDESTIKTVFNRLGFEVKGTSDLEVIIPNRRIDVNTKQDLVEEFVRIFGFENIPSTLPKTSTSGGLNHRQKVRKNIKNILNGIGLDEVITYSLVAEKDVHNFTLSKEEPVSVMSPLSELRQTLRQTPVNGLIEVLEYNSARKMSNMQIFEISDVYFKNRQIELISGAFSGVQSSTLHSKKVEVADFYYVKGIVERIAQTYNVKLTYKSVEKIDNENYNVFQTALVYLDEKEVGYITKLHPRAEQEFSLKDVYIFCIELDTFLGDSFRPYKEISKYPSIHRDLALVYDKDVESQIVKDEIIKTSKKLLKSITEFDVYTGVGLNENEKSVAYNLEFLSEERTLEVEEINNLVNKILDNLSKINVRLR